MFNLGPKVKTITVDEVMKALEIKKDVVILDVRTPGEFSRGRIKGSINVPVDSITDQVEKIVPDKNQLIYTYCLSGSRSAIGAELMNKLGYANVYSVISGLLAWRAKHFPLEN